MKMKTAMLGCSTLAIALATPASFASPLNGNVSFLSQEEIAKEVQNSLEEGAKANARQFALLNELTQANRNDPKTRNDVNLVKGIGADVQIQSQHHPRQVLTAKETVQLMKEGDIGRTRPLDYAKVLPVGVSVEPISASNVQDQEHRTQSSSNVVAKHKQHLTAENKMARYLSRSKTMTTQQYQQIATPTVAPRSHAQQAQIVSRNVDHRLAGYLSKSNILETRYQDRAKLNKGLSVESSKYVGNTQNMPKSVPFTASKGSNKTSNVQNDNNKKVVKKAVGQSKQAVVQSAYSDFNKKMNLGGGKYPINELLARIARDTGYQLQIDDDKDIGRNLTVNVGKNFNGTHADVLRAVSAAIKSQNMGKLFISPTGKKVRVVYTKAK